LKIHDVIDYLPDILGINIKDEKSIENQNHM